MKKYFILVSLLLCSLTSFSGPFTEKDVPEDVVKEIRQSNIQYSGEERKKNVQDAIAAYVKLQNKAHDSGIPRKDLEIIIVRLHQMYGTNFIKQSVEFDKELEQYKDMVHRVEERVKAEKQKMEEEQETAKIDLQRFLNQAPKFIKEEVYPRAQVKYPKDFKAQRYFLEGALYYAQQSGK